MILGGRDGLMADAAEHPREREEEELEEEGARALAITAARVLNVRERGRMASTRRPDMSWFDRGAMQGIGRPRC